MEGFGSVANIMSGNSGSLEEIGSSIIGLPSALGPVGVRKVVVEKSDINLSVLESIPVEVNVLSVGRNSGSVTLLGLSGVIDIGGLGDNTLLGDKVEGG
jgi:hypothetical protein